MYFILFCSCSYMTFTVCLLINIGVNKIHKLFDLFQWLRHIDWVAHTLMEFVINWYKFSTLENQTQFIEYAGSSMEVYYDTCGCTGTLKWQTLFLENGGEKRSWGQNRCFSWQLISLLFRAAMQIIHLPNKLLDSQLTSQWSVDSDITVTRQWPHLLITEVPKGWWVGSEVETATHRPFLLIPASIWPVVKLNYR